MIGAQNLSGAAFMAVVGIIAAVALTVIVLVARRTKAHVPPPREWPTGDHSDDVDPWVESGLRHLDDDSD